MLRQLICSLAALALGFTSVAAPQDPFGDISYLKLAKDEANWKLVDGGVLGVHSPTRDVLTEETFADGFKLHVEFRCGDQPEATGQRRGNSGLHVQGLYEVQVLDSYDTKSGQKDHDGAIYSAVAPAHQSQSGKTNYRREVLIDTGRSEFNMSDPKLSIFEGRNYITELLTSPVTGSIERKFGRLIRGDRDCQWTEDVVGRCFAVNEPSEKTPKGNFR